MRFRKEFSTISAPENTRIRGADQASATLAFRASRTRRIPNFTRISIQARGILWNDVAASPEAQTRETSVDNRI